jgi:glutathione S-transferase
MTPALFFAPGASSMAPHIALHEAGLRFTPRPLSFARGEHRSPAYLALNPEGKVPTLLIDDRPLTEVAAILFYIARLAPGAGLLPEEAEGQAQALSWMSFAAATLHPARRQGLAQATAAYGIADRRLSSRDWVLGGYSVADIHLFRLFWRFNASLRPAPGLFP